MPWNKLTLTSFNKKSFDKDLDLPRSLDLLRGKKWDSVSKI